MRKIVLLLGIGLVAVLSVFATPAGAQASNGTVTVIHGIPGLTVDVYVNGKLTLEDFAPDTVTAPLELPAGTYQIAIRAANAAADSTPVLAGSATLPAGANASIVAHLDASGQPKLTVFVNDTSSLAAGNTRLVVRHTAAAPAVDVLANGKPTFTNLTNPNQATADLPAGTISASVAAAGTTTPVIGPVDLTLPEATVTVVYTVGSLDGKTLHALVQTIPVSTTPAPTTAPAPRRMGSSPRPAARLVCFWPSASRASPPACSSRVGSPPDSRSTPGSPVPPRVRLGVGREPASGYDLLKMFDRSLAFVWTASQSQLYGELNRLADDGLIEVSNEGPRGRKRNRLGDHDGAIRFVARRIIRCASAVLTRSARCSHEVPGSAPGRI